MKTISIFLLVILSTGAFASANCQKTVTLTALNEMNKSLTKGFGRKLQPEERAILNRLAFLDADDNETAEETGIYQAEMTVMEECFDGYKMTTKKTANGCQITKIESLDRDCG
jgi:hypothetical protein